MKIHIPFRPQFKTVLLNGIKTFTSRTKKLGNIDDSFSIFGHDFKIIALQQMSLHNVSSYWREEGCTSQRDFINIWNELHPSGFNPKQIVWLHEFKLIGGNMATKKKVVRRSSSRSTSNERDTRDTSDSRDDGQRDSGDNDRSSRSSRDSGDDKSAFVNITKLFETKKNPDNLVGTCKVEYLDKLVDLVTEAQDKGKGISFFVFLQGKWGPSLAATLAKEQEDRGSFNDGDRGRDGGRSRSRYQRNSWF